MRGVSPHPKDRVRHEGPLFSLQISLLEMLIDKVFDAAFLPALNGEKALVPHPPWGS